MPLTQISRISFRNQLRLAMTSSSIDEDIDVNDDFDVVIVGAGLAGLTTAYNILKKRVGLRILILESSDNVGGRILQENNSQAFYGNFYQEDIVTLVNELAIPMEKGRDAKRLDFFTKDGPVTREISPIISGQVYYFLKLMQALSTDPKYFSSENPENCKDLAEMSIEKLMNNIVYFTQARSLCKSMLYACCGIEDLEKVSALWFIMMLQGAGGLFRKLSASLGDENRFFLNGGFAVLVKNLEKIIIEEGGIIGRSETVFKIETVGENVFVSTASLKFKCDYAVIAVPPPKNALITVEPELPTSFLKSQNLYEPGKNIFFHATYKESAWASSDSSDCIICAADSGTNLRMTYDATHPLDQKIRTFAGFISKWADDATPRRTIFRALKKCFGKKTSIARCIGYSVGDWVIGDAGSPMSVLRPSPIEFHINPTMLPLERIFFAASEYAKKWTGTADGAIEAGKTAACSILFRERPQALDTENIRNYIDSRRKYVADRPPGIARAHLICLGLNFCLFFFLLRDAYEKL